MKKLSWRDLITTLLAIAGGVLVFAKFENYSWAVIGSWRSAVAVLGVLGIALCLTAAGDLENKSWLNRGEIVLSLIAAGLAVVGVIVSSAFFFYATAITLGVLWLVSTARHIYHSIEEPTHHPATV